MAPHPVPSPKLGPPGLTPEQKRRRVERFRKCIERIDALDPQNVLKRFSVPEVLSLETSIDKALSAAFGYGTPLYLRYNLAATLDTGPLITNAALHSSVLRLVGGPGSYEAQEAQEARKYFSEGKARSIALLRQAIFTLEEEIADAQPIVRVAQQTETTKTTTEVCALGPTVRGGFDLLAAWHRVGRWWRGRS
jgi:hypothetical protein